MIIKAAAISAATRTIASVHAEKDRLPRKRPMKERVVLSWSGGKDSTMTAYHLLAAQRYEIAALLTTVTEEFDRISMHGVRRDLLERQSESLGIPLHKIMIPKDCPNAIYEARMRQALDHFKAQGITMVAFGDLFLEDVRQYRDERLAQAGMTGLYPIWRRDTEELVRTFIGLGFKAILACVDTHAIDASFAGREIDHELLRDLPETADPCGEYGEYHSFVYAGPIFKKEIACRAGDRVMRAERFNYCDIVAA
ncbi:MAG: Dph6-related ATP pyrophosphatase [Steroidobacteraceae bacterium]